jgi:hypothetical protein
MNMFRINEVEYSSVIKKFRSISRMHEHDFVSIMNEGQKSIICLTCGFLYCGKCGKLVTIHNRNYLQHNVYN